MTGIDTIGLGGVALGQFALKSSLLASYNGDTVSAKRFHRRLNQPSIFVQLL